MLKETLCNASVWRSSVGPTCGMGSPLLALWLLSMFSWAPAMATTGGMLILISSPYAKRGEIYRAVPEHFGKDDDPVRGSSNTASHYATSASTLRAINASRSSRRNHQRRQSGNLITGRWPR